MAYDWVVDSFDQLSNFFFILAVLDAVKSLFDCCDSLVTLKVNTNFSMAKQEIYSPGLGQKPSFDYPGCDKLTVVSTSTMTKEFIFWRYWSAYSSAEKNKYKLLSENRKKFVLTYYLMCIRLINQNGDYFLPLEMWEKILCNFRLCDLGDKV